MKRSIALRSVLAALTLVVSALVAMPTLAQAQRDRRFPEQHGPRPCNEGKWGQAYIFDLSAGPVLRDEGVGAFARASGIGLEVKVPKAPWGFEMAVGELLYVDSGQKELRAGLFPVYLHGVRYVGRKGAWDGYHAPCAAFMIDAYLGGCPWAWAAGDEASGLDLWWHWYVRGGVRLSGTFKGFEPSLIGVDVGVLLHDSGDDDAPNALGWYAALYLRLGD